MHSERQKCKIYFGSGIVANTRKNEISTINKIRFDPTNPSEDDIDIRDIAHALSMMTRANGHFTEFYSVARHSVNCALEATARGYPKRVALFCLLHDSAESYIGDMTRPLKMHFPKVRIRKQSCLHVLCRR